jgi:hypothetical protein
MSDVREDEFDGRPELVKKRARVIIVKRAIASVIALFMLATLALLAYNAIQSIRTRNALLDCTTPTGQCYHQSQKRTGLLIESLINNLTTSDAVTRRIVILAASCADESQSQTVEEIQQCVDSRLKVRGEEDPSDE